MRNPLGDKERHKLVSHTAGWLVMFVSCRACRLIFFAHLLPPLKIVLHLLPGLMPISWFGGPQHYSAGEEEDIGEEARSPLLAYGAELLVCYKAFAGRRGR